MGEIIYQVSLSLSLSFSLSLSLSLSSLISLFLPYYLSTLCLSFSISLSHFLSILLSLFLTIDLFTLCLFSYIFIYLAIPLFLSLTPYLIDMYLSFIFLFVTSFQHFRRFMTVCLSVCLFRFFSFLRLIFSILKF